MRVLGRDAARGAYRVRTNDGVTGFVPEALMRSDPARPSHDDAYRWIARHAASIADALRQKTTGEGRVHAPFDRLTLAEE